MKALIIRQDGTRFEEDVTEGVGRLIKMEKRNASSLNEGAFSIEERMVRVRFDCIAPGVYFESGIDTEPNYIGL